MNTTTVPSSITGPLGSIPYYATKVKPLLPTYIHLITSAVFPIYAAAHASLRRPASAAPAKKKKRSGQDDQDRDSENDESSSPIETLTASDAILFPILAGFTLTGLYLLIKWLEDPKLLNQILGYYFSWIGIFFCFKFVKDALYFARSWIFPAQFSWGDTLYKFDEVKNCFTADGSNGEIDAQGSLNKIQSRLPSWVRKCYMQVRRKVLQEITCTITVRKPFDPIRLSLPTTWLDFFAGAIAIFIAFHTTFGIKTPWYLTNLQGFAFCYGSLQFMSPGTSAVGSLMLALLFLYDIYMVFYTPMMVTVATKLDVPIKLLFPKNVSGVKAMAMLGLGDIVVPGIMVAFALRFDLYRYYAKMGSNEARPESDQTEKEQEVKPTYTPARGSWAERTYTAKKLWSPVLQAKNFPKPYFKATMGGYVTGMVSTVLVMTVFDHAQPALLYLVPGVLISFWGTALVKGEVKLAWSFDEGAEVKEKEKKEEEKRTAKAEKEGKKDGDAEKEKKAEGPKQSAEEKEVEAGLKPFFSFNVYFPKKVTSLSVSSGTTGSPDTTDELDQTSNKPLAQTKPSTKETRIDDAETESETSTSASTTSSAEIVSQEEAFEADDSDGDAASGTGTEVMSMGNDEGGAHGVKRRRRG